MWISLVKVMVSSLDYPQVIPSFPQFCGKAGLTSGVFHRKIKRMKFLIPTAKEMSPKEAVTSSAISQKTTVLIQLMSQLTADELAKCYKISPAAAQKEATRWQDLATQTAATYPAICLFNGLMYRQIDRTETAYLSQHVLITSALYGVIPALWPISEHRLDFQQAIRVQGQGLKAYWRSTYDQAMPEEELVSLLSSEFEAVFSPAVRERLVTIAFYENKDGQLKSHSTISKKGRGLLLNQACKEQVDRIDQLKTLSFAGFSYQDDLSTDRQLVFVKQV